MTTDAIASILSVPALQTDSRSERKLRGWGIAGAFRSQRILVGKTPNLTASVAIG